MLGNLEISGGSGSGAVTHTSGSLTDNELIVGNGAGDIQSLGDLGTTTTVLHGNSSGPPAFSSVVLSTDVSGDLPYANLTPATAASRLLGRGSAAGGGDWQEITLGANLTMTGTSLAASGGAGGTPGGADTQVQFNSGGVFAGDADMTFVTDTLTVTKLVAPTSISSPSHISTGAITITPAAGTNLNIALATTGDLVVNTTQLVVDTSAARVGIGTAAPNATLDVRGDVIFNDGSGDFDVRMEGDTDANLFFLDASTDRIGIGTASPGNKVDILGGAGALALVLRQASSTSYTYMSLANDINTPGSRGLLLGYTGSAYASNFFLNGPNGESGNVGTPGAFPLVLATGNTQRLQIDSLGRVIIGATNPTTAQFAVTSGTFAFGSVAPPGGTTMEVVGSTGNIGLFRGTTANGYNDVRVYNDQNSSSRFMGIGYTGSTNASAYWVSGGTGEFGILGTVGNFRIEFATNNTVRMILAETGRLSIGTHTPTAMVHIKAGTTSASTAPLKFTSGTSLTSPEAGAIEFTTDDFFATITTGAARKAFVLDDGVRLTSGKIPIATTNGRLIDSVVGVVSSTFEKAETGSDANVLTYTVGGTDEYLVVQVSTDISAFTGTSIVVTVTWKDSNNATATSSITLSGVTDGSINVPINAKTATNVVVSTVFVGVSTAYNISAVVTRLK